MEPGFSDTERESLEGNNKDILHHKSITGGRGRYLGDTCRFPPFSVSDVSAQTCKDVYNKISILRHSLSTHLCGTILR